MFVNFDLSFVGFVCFACFGCFMMLWVVCGVYWFVPSFVFVYSDALVVWLGISIWRVCWVYFGDCFGLALGFG